MYTKKGKGEYTSCKNAQEVNINVLLGGNFQFRKRCEAKVLLLFLNMFLPEGGPVNSFPVVSPYMDWLTLAGFLVWTGYWATTVMS